MRGSSCPRSCCGPGLAVTLIDMPQTGEMVMLTDEEDELSPSDRAAASEKAARPILTPGDCGKRTKTFSVKQVCR